MPGHLIQQFSSARRRRHQAGLTLVELLVGIAIGLFLIAGATSLFLSNLDASRRLLLETRLNQNIRSAAELITRDLRRAGYWDQAVTTIGNDRTNPNRDITKGVANLSYAFSAPAGAASGVEFALSNNKLQMTIGGGTPQDLTDSTVALVTNFIIKQAQIPAGDISSQRIPAQPALTTCVFTRRYDIEIEAQAPTDPTVRRHLQTSVRVRNDRIGACSP
ncbi:MAG: prepilin-type N-terminal cleavage/methylation domain-containing protein [Burkholderiales bacterium]|nr:prepilin-type N-terminal cleavage/methylation domain-containing protein [Burkholderiales bacterium]MBK8665862.1 prepilin-type N-terminal cleavage/methylation domain-containing protein [Burkholderiales bacterium]